MGGREAKKPLRGRASELATLSSALRDLHTGRGFIAVISGEAGIGKTRLVAEATRSAPALETFWLHASELEKDLPFSLLTSALGVPSRTTSLAAETARFLEAPDLDNAHPVDLRFRMVERFVDLVEAESRNAPVLLVLEDLHWIDAVSPLALARLAAAATTSAIGMIVTLRPYPVREELRAALQDIRARAARFITLDPLGDDDALAIATDQLGSAPGPRLQALIARCGGNPLLVKEIARAHEEGTSQAHAEGEPSPAGDGSALPASLSDALRRRIDDLPERSKRTLKVASVLGSRFSVRDLALATRLAAAELLDDLLPAIEAGVVTEEAEDFGFTHDVVWEAVYEGLPRSARAALHRDVAEQLSADGRQVEHFALHLARGAERGDRRAAGFLLEAAKRTLPTSPAAAISLLEKALDISPPSDPTRAQVLKALIAPLTWLGRLDDAQRIAREALTYPLSPEDRDAVTADLAHALFYQGRFDDALELLGDVTVERETDVAGSQRLRAAAQLGFALAYSDTARADDLCIQILEATRDPIARTTALMARSEIANSGGRVADALRLAEEAVAAASEDPSGEAKRNHPLLGYVSSQVFLDYPGDVLGNVERARLQGSRSGTVWHEPVADALTAYFAFSGGDWDAAHTRAQGGLAQALDLGLFHEAAGPLSSGILVAVLVNRGQLREADAVLREFVSDAGEPHFLVAWARALLLEARGDPASAARALHDAWSSEMARGRTMVTFICGADLVRLLEQAHDEEHVEEVAAAISALSAAMRTSAAAGLARRVDCLVSQDPAAGLEAVSLYDSTYRVPEQAFVREETARLLAREGEKDHAIRLLRAALRVFEELEAIPARDRAIRALNALGARQSARARRPLFGWDSLTPAETRVLELVSKGLTNKEVSDELCIGKRTVETHVARLFRKLEVPSRGALIAKAFSEYSEELGLRSG